MALFLEFIKQAADECFVATRIGDEDVGHGIFPFLTGLPGELGRVEQQVLS
jgi:hypothetical protein